MEAFAEYLLSEKYLRLAAGLIGASSMLLGLFVLSLLLQFKGFALTMLLLGAIEAAIFMTGFYRADAKNQTQMDQYNEESIASVTAVQIDRTKGALRAFFTVKVVFMRWPC
jgi:uncharacterized membrane protein YiaA